MLNWMEALFGLALYLTHAAEEHGAENTDENAQQGMNR